MKYTIEQLEQMTEAQRDAVRRGMDPYGGRYGGGGIALASLKCGGKIKQTGLYRLHKGERVVPAGRLSPAQVARIRAKANRVLGK